MMSSMHMSQTHSQNRGRSNRTVSTPTSKDEELAQAHSHTTANTSPHIETQTNLNNNNNVTMSTNRYSQSPHQISNAIHTISQPYSADSSNFGAFYHHHSHVPSYGNPYDKFKIPSNVHSRSTNSPYGSYQGFYAAPHQIVRPNGYIDLVPR